VGGRRELFLRTLEDAIGQRGVALMGICNVTPDSFSDGGHFFRIEDAIVRVNELVDEGANVIDVGGESTRPGSRRVAAREQLERVLPIVRALSARNVCVSIDTMNAAVAEACLEAGATLVNDVSCLADDAIARVAARESAPLILMHSRPSHFAQAKVREVDEQETAPEKAYVDIATDVVHEWKAAVARAAALGLDILADGAVIMDPGLGFAKTADESAELLSRTRELVESVGVPVLVGASRKSFLTLVDVAAGPRDRIGASLAAALVAARGGARILRVHDVRATRQALDVVRTMSERTRRGEVSHV
jgi:dihydropteroate synthase